VWLFSSVSRLVGLPDLLYSSLRIEVVWFQLSRDHYRIVDFVGVRVYKEILLYMRLS